MANQKENNTQQGRWETYLATVPQDVMEAMKFLTAEGITIKFFVQLNFLEQEYGSQFPPILEEQSRRLAETQAAWSTLPTRNDVTPEETTATLSAVRDATAQAEATRKEHADSLHIQKVNYPALIAGLMESIRLHGHTPLRDNALALLKSPKQNETVVEFGETLVKVFQEVFAMPEESPALPAPVRVAPVESVRKATVEPAQLIPAAAESQNRKIDLGFHWADMGIDSGGAEYQAYNNALLDLAKKFPQFFPHPDKNSRLLLLALKTTPDPRQVLDMLRETFQKTSRNAEPDKAIARMLTLIAWREGEKVQDWHLFVDHAQKIIDGTAKTLLPEPPEEIIYQQPTEVMRESVVAAKKETIRTDRFPQTDAEIELYIKKTLKLFDDMITQKGKAVTWPMNPGQFANVVKNVSKRCVDENKKLVGFEGRDIPYFTRLAYIKLLSLEEFQRINPRDLSKAFKRFDAIYEAKFKNK